MAKSKSITYIDRESGMKRTEKADDSKSLNFLYHSPFGKLPLAILAKRKLLSSVAGKLMDSKISKSYIQKFIKGQNLDMDDYVGVGGYQNFNQFFCRKLKPEARPQAAGLTSPADGKVLAFESIDCSRKFFVKGCEFDLLDFLADEKLAEKYAGGSMAIIRLAPSDYHRFHFPADGLVTPTNKVKGAYYSVSPIALDKKIEIFCQNKREYSELRTEKNGDILICEVGATLVGSIIQTYSPFAKVKKGQEKGYFRFGGSSIVLLFEKGKATLAADLVRNTLEGYETTIRMGENIGY